MPDTHLAVAETSSTTDSFIEQFFENYRRLRTVAWVRNFSSPVESADVGVNDASPVAKTHSPGTFDTLRLLGITGGVFIVGIIAAFFGAPWSLVWWTTTVTFLLPFWQFLYLLFSKGIIIERFAAPPIVRCNLAAVAYLALVFMPFGWDHKEHLPSVGTEAVTVAIWVFATLVMRAIGGKRLPWYKDEPSSEEEAGSPLTCATAIPNPWGLTNEQLHNLRFGAGVFLGFATGVLQNAQHGRGIAPGVAVGLGVDELRSGAIVFGEKGTGKSRAVLVPMLAQFIDVGIGTLLIDPKMELKNAIIPFAQARGRDVHIVGPGNERYNVFTGKSPSENAARLKQAFIISGQGEKESAFWVQSAVIRSQGALAMLHHVPGAYNLTGLRDFCFDDDFHDKVLSDIGVLMSRMAPEDPRRRALEIAWKYETKTWPRLDPKTRASVEGSLQSITEAFQDLDMVDTFCGPNDVDLAWLNDGDVIILDLDFRRYGDAAKTAALFLKEDAYSLIMRRPPSGDGCPDVAIMIDEYQTIANATDAEAADRLRSRRGSLICATQSISSLLSAIKDEHTVHRLVNDFGQKIIFKNSDLQTINYASDLIGEVDIVKTTDSCNDGRSYGIGDGLAIGLLGGSQWQHGTSTSTTTERQKALTAQTFRELSAEGNFSQAVAMLTVDGVSRDDVLVIPKYIGQM